MAARRVMQDWWDACRPSQWQKNVLLYAAFLFSAGLAWSWQETSSWLPLLSRTTIAFMLFNILASGEYLINDVLDIDRDRQHPRKGKRPVASGRISERSAVIVGAILFLSGMAGSVALSIQFAGVAGAYVCISLAYSVILKQVVIVDVITIASLFALRGVAGAVVIGVPLSPWLLVCTAIGALFVAILKRWQELVLLGNAAPDHRAVFREYSVASLSEMSSVAASATIVAYALYVVSAPNLPSHDLMLLTLPFVIYGIFRYRLIAERTPERNADELILRDVPLLLAVALFGITALFVMTFWR